MKVHNITISAFFREDELEKGRQIFRQFLPEDAAFKEERLEPETDGGVFTTPLYTLKAVLNKPKQAEEFASTLLARLSPEDRKNLQDSIAERLDDDCDFYLRLDRRKLAEGKITLHTRSPIHVKIKIACFPRKKDAAVKIAQELLNAE